ncbi:nicotinate-nicotinamide nucleotide adenylyltransferase, partial [bacterium]|nr:nicotinate-nicotinamide nucleotide adenylyltransferase [bacterium]
DGPSASPGIRLEMLRAALRGNSRLETEDLELRRKGPSFTVETLAAIAAEPRWRGAELVLMVGSDMLLDLPRWRRPDEILRIASLLAAERSGFDSRAAGPDVLARTVFLRSPRIDISSSGIRSRIAEGKSVRYRVPESVERIIQERGLYR